jgi:rubrerythrin
MTKQEQSALLLVVERIKAMTTKGSTYGGVLLTDSQAGYLDSWVMPLLTAVATPAADRTYTNKTYLRHAEDDYASVLRHQQKKAAAAVPKITTYLCSVCGHSTPADKAPKTENGEYCLGCGNLYDFPKTGDPI